MRLQKKSYSRVSLLDLLRRKRSNLRKFLLENGIVTYELLSARCDSMGVVPPGIEDFIAARGSVIPEFSSPREGVVVMLPDQETSNELFKEISSDVVVVSDPLEEEDSQKFMGENNPAASKKKKKYT